MKWLSKIMTQFQRKPKSAWKNAPKQLYPEDDEYKSTPQSTPESSPVAMYVPVVRQRMIAPVQIPKDYLYQKTNCVGGKQVPFTRSQVRNKRRRMRPYQTIYEEDPIFAC